MLRLSLLVVLLCPRVSSSLLGWVGSPGYPNGYPSDTSHKWSRCASKGHVLSIQLIHLDLEDSLDCENDAVKVFSDGNLILVLCGKRDFEELQLTVNPQLRSSPGGCLNLSFHSDYSNKERHSGFKGFYSVQDYNECEEDFAHGCTHFCHNFIGGYYCSCHHGYHLDADNRTCTVSCTEDLSGQSEGHISSPLWPSSYTENSHCVYTLSVEPHLQLELHFSEAFDVEQNYDGQCIDTVRVKTLSGTLGTFCGDKPPPSPFLTHSHHVQIHFTTDGFGTNNGFSVHFKTREKVCLPAISPYSSVTPHKAEYHKGQVVTVTCDTGYFVNTYDRTLKVAKEYKTTCQSTGEWTPSYTCQPVNCGHPNIPEDDILVLVGSDQQQTQYKDQIRFNCSSTYYVLQGDDTYTCGAGGEWVSSDNKIELPKCIEVCGMPKTHPSNTGRIFGGQDANLGEIPWYLLIKEPLRGGASLITDRWAVTAAHVVDGFEEASLQFFGGLIDGKTADSNLANVVKLHSDRIIIHPGYTKGLTSRTTYDNDIALIRFKSRVSLNQYISPICLPESNQVLTESELGTVAGFGVTERNVIARMLKHAPISIYSEQKCQNTPVLPPNRIMAYTQNMFCAGSDGQDSCEQDSGGPFFTPKLGAQGRPHQLMGIVSWGPRCYMKQFKGYYTKVQNYVQWIHNTIEEVENSLKEQERK